MPRTVPLFKPEADLLGTLAHPIRLQILEVLRDGEACVCHLQATLQRRQAYISQHLMALREAGLVTSHKEGLRVYYQLSDPHILEVLRNVRAVAHSCNGDVRLPPPRGQCHCPQCQRQR